MNVQFDRWHSIVIEVKAGRHYGRNQEMKQEYNKPTDLSNSEGLVVRPGFHLYTVEALCFRSVGTLGLRQFQPEVYPAWSSTCFIWSYAQSTSSRTIEVFPYSTPRYMRALKCLSAPTASHPAPAADRSVHLATS